MLSEMEFEYEARDILLTKFYGREREQLQAAQHKDPHSAAFHQST